MASIGWVMALSVKSLHQVRLRKPRKKEACFRGWLNGVDVHLLIKSSFPDTQIIDQQFTSKWLHRQIIETLLGSHEKSLTTSGLGSKTFGVPNFNEKSLSGKCYTFRTYILIDISLVDFKCDFAKKRTVFVRIISRVSGNVKDLLRPFVLIGATKLFKLS